MKKQWIAALLAAVMLLALTAGGAASPAAGSEADKPSEAVGLNEDDPVPDGPGSADPDDSGVESPDSNETPAPDPAVEYDFTPQKTAYSYLAVSPQGTQSPFSKPIFQSGVIRVKGGAAVPADDLRYEWYAADLNGNIEKNQQGEDMLLGTEASFSTENDPAYNLNRVGTHFYLERILIGEQEVGRQLFLAAVMSTGMDLTVAVSQNGEPVADSPNVADSPVTLVANFDSAYFASIRTYIQQDTKSTAIALSTQPQITNASIRASWHPQGPDIQADFTGGSGLNPNLPPDQTPVKPTLTITSFTSPTGYIDFYFSMTFPFTATTKLLGGGTQSGAGELRTLTRLVRVYSGEPVATPTPPSGDDPGTVPMPSDWTTNLFAEPPLTQAQSEALYRELITPYSDPRHWSTPFALAPAQMTPEGYLSQSSQQSLLNLINFIRRSAGVHMIDTIDQQYTRYCQAGTNYMSEHNQFGHDVANNSGNQNAITGLRDSNLSWVQSSDGAAAPLEQLQLGQFYDDDYNNLPNVGHRRWLLDCRQTKTGFGYTAPTGTNPKTYEATYVLDRISGSSVPDSLEAFPGIGAYPIELMDFRAWSIGVGALGGRSSSWTVNEDDIRMSITRLSDGKSWSFEPFGSGSYLNKNSNWFEVIGAGRGSGPMILFRPASIFSSGNFWNTEELIGETYTIKIEGIRDENGAARTIIYGTQFYSLADSSALQPPPAASAEPTASPSPSKTASPSPSRTASPSPSKTASPSATPVPTAAPSAQAVEAVQWWKLANGRHPVMEVRTAPDQACTYQWYALSSTDQDPASGVLLSETGTSCTPDTVGWKGGQIHHFACVVQFANQQADGTGKTVIPFTIHVEALPTEVTGGIGIADSAVLPDKPAGVDAGYQLNLAPDAFDDPQHPPELTVADKNAQWTITAAGTGDETVFVDAADGATVQIPDRCGLYVMTARTADGTLLFVVPVKGTVQAAPADASVGSDDQYTLPYGSAETTIRAGWDGSAVKPPLASCVEYVWKLLGADTAGRAGGPVLTPNGTDVRQLDGEATWIASGEGADTAVLSGLTAGQAAEVYVIPCAPGTYESQQAVELGNPCTTEVQVAPLPVITYPDMTAVVGQSENVSSTPTVEAVAGVRITYSISDSLPAGGPSAQIDSTTGVVTVPASALQNSGYWTYAVHAQTGSDTAAASVGLTVAGPAPTQRPTASPSADPSQTSGPSPSVEPSPSTSLTAGPTASPTRVPPTTRPPIIPTYVPTYNPNPSWTTLPTASSSASPSPSGTASPGPSVPAITAKPDAPFSVAVAPNPAGGNELLTGVPISTKRTTYTAADVIAALEVPSNCSLAIETADGLPLAADKPVGTGCTAVLSGTVGETRYTIVVLGDVLGSGRLDMAQLVRLAADLTGKRPLEGVYYLAGKLTSTDGSPNIADLVVLARMLTRSGE